MKKILAFASAALTLGAFAAPQDVTISFSSTADTYKDGAKVLDGEAYALVWTKDGSTFGGFLPDGTCAKDTDKLVVAAALAKSGKCAGAMFVVDEKEVLEKYQGGTFGVFLLDTRDAEGKVTALVGGKPSTVNAYAVAATGIAGTGFGDVVAASTALQTTIDAVPPVSYVAMIGSTGYETLEAAIEEGGDITLLTDVELAARAEIVSGKKTSIDLNGHAITYGGAEISSGIIIVHNGAELTINDSSEGKTGSIVSGAKAYAAVQLTLKGDDATNAAKLTVNGGTLTGTYYAICGNGSRPNTEITINGGTLNATAEGDNYGIYHPQVGTLTITGGTITGYCAAVEMRAGALNVSGGTFTALASEFSYAPNGSGSTTIGAAIAIAQHTTKKDIAATITGGTFVGAKAIAEVNPQENDPAPQVEMSISGGTFEGGVTLTDVEGCISGGLFKVVPDVKYIVPEAYKVANWTEVDAQGYVTVGAYTDDPTARTLRMPANADKSAEVKWTNGEMKAYVDGTETLLPIRAQDTLVFDENFKATFIICSGAPALKSIKVESGTIKIGHDGQTGNNLPEGMVVAIAEGAAVQLGCWMYDDYGCGTSTIKVPGATFDGPGKVTLAKYVKNVVGAIGGTALVDVNGATISVEGSIAQAITGKGTVNAYTGMVLDEGWTGTVVTPTTLAKGVNLGAYGNANSTIKLGGDFALGGNDSYLTKGCTINGDLNLDGHTIELTNGWTDEAGKYTINRLVGEGTITTQWKNSYGNMQKIVIENVLADDGKTIAFTGTITGTLNVVLPAGYELDAEGHIVVAEYPAEVVGKDATVKAKYDAWVKANNITDRTAASNVEAFILNCAPAQVDTEKDAFKVSITIGADGTPVVTTPEGKVYNGTITIVGSETLKGEYSAAKVTDKSAKFFKAILSL